MMVARAASVVSQAGPSNQPLEIQQAAVLALETTLQRRDPTTGSHSRKLREFAERTAIQMGFDVATVQVVCWAALLHDIGKMGVPEKILNHPGPLSADEWVIMKRHPQIGADIVLRAADLSQIASLILSHHEKYDGSGYPYGLKEEEIPLGARILAVVDAYSAMVDGRVYRPARSHMEAVTEIERCAGIYYDPRVVKAFLSLFD
jgi:putative nucleotidyltransferase with HDIG domain